MVLVLVRALEVGVPVLPLLAEVVDVDERHAGLDEPPGQEQILPAHLPRDGHFRTVAAAAPFAARQRRRAVAVAITEGLRLLRQIERAAHLLRAEQPKGVVVATPHVADGSRSAAERREPIE